MNADELDMLKNLDLLINLDLLENESDWSAIQNLTDLGVSNSDSEEELKLEGDSQ